MVQTSKMGLTQKGFTSRWSYLTNANPRKALEHMMYLGLHMEPSLMQRQFSISKTRQQERRRGKDFHGRGVFQVSCYNMIVEVLYRLLRGFYIWGQGGGATSGLTATGWGVGGVCV